MSVPPHLLSINNPTTNMRRASSGRLCIGTGHLISLMCINQRPPLQLEHEHLSGVSFPRAARCVVGKPRSERQLAVSRPCSALLEQPGHGRSVWHSGACSRFALLSFPDNSLCEVKQISQPAYAAPLCLEKTSRKIEGVVSFDPFTSLAIQPVYAGRYVFPPLSISIDIVLLLLQRWTASGSLWHMTLGQE